MKTAGWLKEAARSLSKDFAAGVEPLGMLTYQYGADDASKRTPREKRVKALAAGTVGGLIGGGLLVPAAVGSVVRGGEALVKSKGGIASRVGQAASAAVSGAREPFQIIVDANRGSRAVRRVIKGGKAMSKSEAASVKRLSKKISIKGLEDAAKRTGSTPGKLLRNMGRATVSRDAAKAIEPSISGTAKGVNAAFGTSAAISGGTALVGYMRGERDETDFQRRLGKRIPSSIMDRLPAKGLQQIVAGKSRHQETSK